ncbi:MAG: copper chaperone PCu(A)C [Burkholderiales bacterium]
MNIRLLRALTPWVIASLALIGAATPARAHGYKIGAIVIEHPYATPTPPAARTGAVYLRALRNTGEQPDRLIGATSPVAASVQIHEMRMDGDVMRMRELPALDLAPGATPAFGHGQALHLMLVDLKQPLKNGDSFPVTLKFERAGTQEVRVPVQIPREAAAPAPDHKH